MMIIDLHAEPERHVPWERAIHYRWPLLEQETSDLGDPATYRLWVNLDIDHHGKAEWAGQPDRCFRAVLCLQNETKLHNRPIVKTAVRLGGSRYVQPILIAKESVARYSAKQQDRFAREALAALRAIADEEVIVAFLARCREIAALGDEDAA